MNAANVSGISVKTANIEPVMGMGTIDPLGFAGGFGGVLEQTEFVKLVKNALALKEVA